MNNDDQHARWQSVLVGKPVLFVLSGPSGVGKDAVLDTLKQSPLPLEYIVTTTTRPRRDYEAHGREYKFVSPEAFQKLIDTDGLLEWAEVYGNRYGVPAADVEAALTAGNDVMVKVDIQGVDNIRRKMPEAITIFLAPPSLEELFGRLRRRNTESEESLAIRMNTAAREMDRMGEFDYVVLNPEGRIERAIADVQSIVNAEKCRVRRR